MTINEFSDFCSSLASDDLNIESPAILHSVLGIAGEAGELVDAIKKNVVYHSPLDMDNVKEELGDLLHYIMRLTTACGWTFQDVIDTNVAKLQIRYPNGYSNEAAIARADKGGEK